MIVSIFLSVDQGEMVNAERDEMKDTCHGRHGPELVKYNFISLSPSDESSRETSLLNC